MGITARLSRRSGGAILNLDGMARLSDFGDWKAKSEYHVTLLGKDGLGALLRDIGRLKIIQAEIAISRAAAEIEWRVRLLDEWWRVEDGKERTIVQLADVDGAEAFFTNLEWALETKLARPPYHVTLFTADSPRGIGVSTREDLERLGRRLDGAELDELRSRLH
ncbi:MAG TPA: hypothetical protein VF698_16945 [Thermoanaerobaculia bacterium]|jgi:hypothetical protein